MAVAVERPLVAIGEVDEISESTPNVIGLTLDQAVEVFLDAGYEADSIVESAVPAGGTAGLVVGQEPKPRIQSTGRVVLHISESTTTPDLVGLTTEEAKEGLRAFGTRAVVESDYDPTVSEGQVLATEPTAGAHLPDEVTLTVSEAPSAVFLRSLRAGESEECRTDSVSINDQTWEESYVCQASTDGAYLTFAVNADIARITAHLAQSVRNTDDIPITAQVLADGQVVEEIVLQKGTAAKFDANVLGSSSVTIRFTRPELEGSVSARVLVGNPTFVGSRPAVDTLEETTGR